MLADMNGKSIVLLVDDYVPDSTKVAAKMMHELAVELVGRGNKVYVVTPSCTINTQCEYEYIDGVLVVRFKLGPIKNCSFVLRAINETFLPFKARVSTYKFFKDKEVDLIVSYSPSIFWGRFAKTLKKIFICPVYLILRDFFPQWVIDNGMIGANSATARYFRYHEALNYQSADFIGIQSLANIEFFKECFGDKYHTRLLYNWASPTRSSNSSNLKKEWGLENKVLFFYGGNIGKAQDMLNLVRLAKRLQHIDQAHFVFLGQGDEVELISETIQRDNIKNITLLPPVSQDKFKAILKEVDVGLFSLCRDHTSHNFPGKILGYMVNQIPILGSVNFGNDLKSIIKEYNAGFVTVNGDDEQLYQNAVTLIENVKLRKELGANAEYLLHARFTVAAAADEILSILDNQG